MGCGSLCVSIPTLGGPFDWDKHLKDAKHIYLNDLAEHRRIANEYRLSKGKGKLPPTPEAVRRRRDEPSSPMTDEGPDWGKASSPMTDEEPGWTDEWLTGEVEYQGRVVEGLR